MAATTWQIDTSHSTIGFSVRHLIIAKVHGRFAKWHGAIQIDDEAIERSRVDIQIDAASVDTNEPTRDAHLRSADFFEVETYPHITFTSTRVERLNAETLRITGDLTIHGVTQPTAFEIEHSEQIRDPWGNHRRGFAGRATIDRKTFGVSFNPVLDTGGVGLGDRVDITFEIEAFTPIAVPETVNS